MTDVNKRIDELIEIAKKTSPGPWKVQDFNDEEAWVNGFDFGYDCQLKKADAKFIATFNPAFVLKLLESWKEMRKSLNSIANADGPSSWGDVFAKEAGEALAKADKVFE